MKGTSSKTISLQRVGGWCKPMGNACESILERNAKRLEQVSISGTKPLFRLSGGHFVFN